MAVNCLSSLASSDVDLDEHNTLKSLGGADAQAPKTLPCDLTCPNDGLAISIGASEDNLGSSRTGEDELDVLPMSSFRGKFPKFRMGSLRIHVLARGLAGLKRLFLMRPKFWELVNSDVKGLWTKRRLFQALLVRPVQFWTFLLHLQDSRGQSSPRRLSDSKVGCASDSSRLEQKNAK